MRQLLPLVLAAAICAVGTPVLADDSLANFDGFYAGFLLTGLLPTDAGSFTSTAPIPAGGPAGYSYSQTPTGTGYGIDVGYTYNFGGFDAGIVADYSRTIAATKTYIDPAESNNQDMVKVDAVGHLKALVGYPIDGFEPFVTGGIAMLQLDRSHQGAVDAATPPTLNTWSQGSTQFGASIGVGADLHVMDHVTYRIEATEDFFPSQHTDWTASPARSSDNQVSMTSIRMAINYQF